jgi:hypothetical protein
MILHQVVNLAAMPHSVNDDGLLGGAEFVDDPVIADSQFEEAR